MSKQLWFQILIATFSIFLHSISAAQTPACGSVISTDATVITFDSDMVCDPEFTGNALTVQASDVTVDGAGFAIVAPLSARLVSVLNADHVSIQDLVATGNSGVGIVAEGSTYTTISGVNASSDSGTGIALMYTSHSTVSGNIVHGRHLGFQFAREESYNTVTANDFSGNNVGITVYGGGFGGTGNVVTENNVSNSATWGIQLGGQTDLTIEGNDYTGSSSALRLMGMDSITVSDKDFSTMNIPNTVLGLENITNSTITRINTSGTSDSGAGITCTYCEGNLITENIVHGRHLGFQFAREESYNTVTANDFSGNNVGITVYGGGFGGTGNVVTENNVSNSATWGIQLGGQTDLTIEGNDYTGSSSALRLMGMDSITVSDKDFSTMNIPNTVLGLENITNSTITRINASGTTDSGAGITCTYCEGNLITENIVHGRHLGFQFAREESYNTVTANDFSGNNVGITVYGGGFGGTGNVVTENNVSNSATWGIQLGGQTDLTIEGNDYTGSSSALRLMGMDSITVSDKDFSTMNIPNTVLGLENITNSTITRINASGTTGTGTGIGMSYCSDNLITGNTVHGRASGVQLARTEDRNTISANDFSGNNAGIRDYSHSFLKIENVILDNDVSGSSYRGISLANHLGTMVRGNIVEDTVAGIVLYGGSDNLIVSNSISGTQNIGLKAETEVGLIISENNVMSGGSDGLMLLNSADARVYHNNIHGNAGWQVTSNVPTELSYGNEGNYWGRICEPEDILFIAGTDSNAVDVVDSHPYASADAWLEELDPGCAPPQLAIVSGSVTDSYGPISGTTIGILDAGGLLDDVQTDSLGEYGFADLEEGIYALSLIEPIGYVANTPTEVEVILNYGDEALVDFRLERVVSEIETRGWGFWKHQARANLTGRGKIHESEVDLLAYLQSIKEQYPIFEAGGVSNPVFPDVSDLEGLSDILDPPKPMTMRERAEGQLMALLLNLTSLRIATYTEVSPDDTAGEAVDFIIMLLMLPGEVSDELELAKDLAEALNAEMIPLDPEIIPEL